MGFTVKINKKLAEDTWSASGSFTGEMSDGTPVKCDAEILVKKTGNTLRPVLDSNLAESRCDGRIILHYVNPEPVEVEEPVKKGTEVSFNKIWFNLDKKR